MTFWLALLAIPAVYRASLMVTQEEGPFSVFEWLRNRPLFLQPSWLGRGIRCAWCVSFWLSALVAPIVLYSPEEALDLRLVLFYWWGLAGTVVWLLQRYNQHRS